MEGNQIFNRLYDLETPPPSGMWNRIAQTLDEEDALLKKSEAPVLSISSKKNNWQRIALAASFIGFVAMTALWVSSRNNTTNSNENSNSVAKETNTITPTVESNNTNNTTNNNSVASTTPIQNNTVTAPSNTTNNINSINSIKQNNTTTNNQVANNNVAVQNNASNNTIKATVTPSEKVLVQQKANTPKDIATVEQPKVVIRDQNGNPIKSIEVAKTIETNNVSGPDSKGDKAIGSILSKISVASDKEEIDSIINQSNYWKNQINIWRSKLIKSGYAPSVVNSLDIIELKKLIDENK